MFFPIPWLILETFLKEKNMSNKIFMIYNLEDSFCYKSLWLDIYKASMFASRKEKYRSHLFYWFYFYIGKITACEIYVKRVSRESFTWISHEFHVKFVAREFHFWRSFHVKNLTWNSHEIHVNFTRGDFACVLGAY